jgi:ABC-type transport system involved in cytochrome bd biosynthesis fused ATPase/permease subunit
LKAERFQKVSESQDEASWFPQEPFLFNETVRANLLWAQPGATEEDLRGALRASRPEQFVDQLPSGLDTLVGDRGVRLSGGERQRLTMARALLGQPSILILDEATSSLDTENERLIQDAIHRLHGELTVIVIAHRLFDRAQSRLDYCAESRRNCRARHLADIGITARHSYRGNGATRCIINGNVALALVCQGHHRSSAGD